ncbi:MAG: hypothetical protein IJ679_02695 [Lachnospiraceae bacterium]|nr:hypothetical protein [Lachnospiraceae bacterium]
MVNRGAKVGDFVIFGVEKVGDFVMKGGARTGDFVIQKDEKAEILW